MSTKTAAEPDIPAVKFIEEDGEWFIEGMILPYGGVRTDGQDLTGSHFTKGTDFCDDWFPAGGRPGLYRHGFDADLQTSVIGREVKSWSTPKGRWLRAQIDKAHEYASEVKQMLDDGLLALSSGAVDHLVRISSTKSGEIQRWPWVEWSLVPNPANPEALLYQVKSVDAVAHLEAAGDPVPEALKDDAAAKDAEQAAQELLALALGAWLNPAAKAGARNSAGDQNLIQTIHDHAMSLGADCSASKSYETPPAPVLAIAGDNVERPTDVDLASVKSMFRDIAVAQARRYFNR